MTPSELRERRGKLGLTQAQLAALLHVTPNTLARWERGEMPMSGPVPVAMLAIEAGLVTLEGTDAEPVGKFQGKQ